MTAHVFIVDDKTLPLHLRYQFAGTGAQKHSVIDFNDAAQCDLYHTTENMLVGMIADVSRIRKGDRVFFYLQQGEGQEGRFYGMFRAVNSAFLDNDDSKQFLRDDLGKSLTFRVRIEPDEVYPQGVTEWHALDEIKNITAPYQMLWSLIYRKLKGNRGCTMIMPYEEEALCNLIRVQNRKNARESLSCNGRSFDLNPENREIIVCEESSPIFTYAGSANEFSLLPRILEKSSRRQQFEVHLQAHIAGTFGLPGDSLSKILLGHSQAKWLGNEVSCGVGMQRIDLMTSYTGKDGMRHVMPIELKSVKAEEYNIRQIQRYVDWIQQYFIPNCQSIISPVLLTKSGGELSDDLMERIRQFNQKNSGDICQSLRMIEFEVCEGDIQYQERTIS